jgi:DNA-damage-inducible protein D
MTDLPIQSDMTFEDFGHTNGVRFWYARDFAAMLGYADWNTFRRGPFQKAHNTCLTLKIDLTEAFQACRRDVDGREVEDFKLTRFACHVIAMQGDPRKPQVASAQAYFAQIAAEFREAVEALEDVERVSVRGELSVEERALSSIASSHGVKNFAFFQDAGYRGMYNMGTKGVREIKGAPPDRSPLDFMGSTELAANLFRITQTNERVKKDAIHGQRALETTAKAVGETVRQTMIELSGTAPEDLPAAEDLRDVQKKLRTTQRSFRKMDQLREGRAD